MANPTDEPPRCLCEVDFVPRVTLLTAAQPAAEATDVAEDQELIDVVDETIRHLL